MAQETKTEQKPAAAAAAPAPPTIRFRIEMLIVSIVGVVLTWAVWNFMKSWVPVPTPATSASVISGGLNVVVSAGFGLFGGLFFKKHFAIFYSATFAGMCSATVLGWGQGPIIILWPILLGVILWVIFILLEKKFAGVGGKLGMMAMFAGQLVALIIMAVPGYNPYPGSLHPIYAGTSATYSTDWAVWVFGPLVGGLACVITVWLMEKRPDTVKNSTISSGMVGLIGGFLALLLGGIGWTMTDTVWAKMCLFFAQALFTGSFVGMSPKTRIQTGGKMPQYLAYFLTGIISTFVLLAITPILGTGGKFGFSAFCSVLIWNLLIGKLLAGPKKAAA